MYHESDHSVGCSLKAIEVRGRKEAYKVNTRSISYDDVVRTCTFM